MLLPARTAVLNYLYGVKSADIKEIMEALKPQYGGERQFTKARYLDHVMSLEANGLLDLESYSLVKQANFPCAMSSTGTVKQRLKNTYRRNTASAADRRYCI